MYLCIWIYIHLYINIYIHIYIYMYSYIDTSTTGRSGHNWDLLPIIKEVSQSWLLKGSSGCNRGHIFLVVFCCIVFPVSKNISRINDTKGRELRGHCWEDRRLELRRRLFVRVVSFAFRVICAVLCPFPPVCECVCVCMCVCVCVCMCVWVCLCVCVRESRLYFECAFSRSLSVSTCMCVCVFMCGVTERRRARERQRGGWVGECSRFRR